MFSIIDNIHIGKTIINSGALRIYGGLAPDGTSPTICCRGNIRIDEKASLEFGQRHQHIFQGVIYGGGTLAVLKEAAVYLARGSLQSALALYEGSAFGLLPLCHDAVVDIPRLEVRGAGARWNGDLKMGEGKIITFYIPDAVTDEATMLAVWPFSPKNGGRADLRGGEIRLEITGGSLSLKYGETVVLIDSHMNSLASDHDGREITVTDGVGRVYKFILKAESRRLTATLTGYRHDLV